MTNQPTSQEFAVFVQSQSDLRSDLKEMSKEHREDMQIIAKTHVDFSEKFAAFVERDVARSDDIAEIKGTLHNPDDGIDIRLRKVEKKQAVSQVQNSDRWKILGTFVGSVIVIGSAFAAFIYYIIRTIPIAGGP